MKPLVITQQITDRTSESLNKLFVDINNFDRLSKIEEARIGNLAKCGDVKAIETLVNSNLRFVVSVAKQYQIKSVELIDLISVGSMGSLEAARKFDPDRGVKFISFAVWDIRKRILEYLNNLSRQVRINSKINDNIRDINRITSSLEQELERVPTINEIIDSASYKYTKEQVLNAISARKINVSSYDIELESGTTRLEMMKSNFLESDYKTNISDIIDSVKNLTDILSIVEYDIIKHTYGLGGSLVLQVSDLAKKWEYSEPTIRKIRDKAIRKMKVDIKINGEEEMYMELL